MKLKKIKLKNGLRILTIPMADNPTATVLVLVETGSSYEDKKSNGISHFLEHLCFKGTEKRPRTIDIAKELDGIGSDYNAFTGREYTGYYAKAEAKHFDHIFDIITDIYLNPCLNETDIEKEKGIIVDEIRMYADTPASHIHDIFAELMYGDQPAGRLITGTKETVKSFTKKDIVKYRNEHYVASGTIVIVAGNIKEDEVIRNVKKIFSSISSGKKNPIKKVKEVQREPKVLIENRKTDQTHLVLGVRTFPDQSKYEYVLDVIGALLGGGMSSRLFHRVREEMGVGYYVGAHNSSYKDHGFLKVSTGVDNKKAKEVVVALIEELEKLKNEPVSEEELKKGKDFLVGNMYLGLESSNSIASFYGSQEMVGKKMLTPIQIEKEIKKVTSNDITEVANIIFQDRGLNLAVVGPFKKEEDFLEILKFNK